MKLKFRAEPQDILIFIIFAIFLLYLVALLIVNLPSLASEGTFAGLNPLPAFEEGRLFTTIVFYLLALGGLFMSVSSYFFDREDGFGFSTSKKSKGYSRWLKEKEMKEELKCVHPSDETSEYAGIPLISNGKELWVDDGEFHNLVIGATGSGKTQSTILPAVKVLAKKGESIICTDPKGEIYEKTGAMLKAKGYDIVLLNFRNPQKGNAWNPLTLPYKLYKNGNQDKAIELLDDLALNILYEENNGNADPFWEKTSADYFSGIALGLFEDAKEEQININSISLTTTVGEDKCGGSNYAREYFNLKDPNSAAFINASSTIMAPSETKGSIIAVFKQKIKLFSSRENLSEMLSYSDFDLESIGKKKTAVFIIIQDEKKTYHSLATIFVKQCYETLIDVAQSNGGKLPVRTNFLLDEFANMPPLKDVTTMITAARSRQIRFTLIIQNFAQLKQVYGAENAETIKGNCGNLVYLISTELAALEEISKLAGEEKSKKDDKTASTPLVTVSDLQRMKQFDQIVLRMRKNPFKTSFVPDFKIDWGKDYGQVTYPERTKKKVETFDIRDFVKEKRQEKIKEMMNNGGTMPGGPTGGGMYGGMPPMMGGFPGTNNQMPSNNMMGNNMPNPMANRKPPQQKAPDINIDDLVKKIDAKIAEIEEEEKKEKEKKAQAKIEKAKEKEEQLLQPKKEEIKPEVEKIEQKIAKEIEKHEEKKSLEKPSLITNDLERKINEKLNQNNKLIQEQSKKQEEKIEKQELNLQKLENKINNMVSNNIDDKILGINNKPKEEIIKAEPKPVVVEKKPSDVPEIVLEDKIDDDDFFDDFFDD